jgi:fatty acid desaturase
MVVSFIPMGVGHFQGPFEHMSGAPDVHALTMLCSKILGRFWRDPLQPLSDGGELLPMGARRNTFCVETALSALTSLVLILTLFCFNICFHICHHFWKMVHFFKNGHENLNAYIG